MTARLLLVQSGRMCPAVVERFGDFDGWFVRALEGLEVAWTVTRPFAGDPLPDPSAFDAVLMTGALESVCDRAPWMCEAERWLRSAVVAPGGPALLGVCFGHQLLARAFGAVVGRNPAGAELGTVEVELTAEGRSDPLLGAALPARFLAHQTHLDAVLELPPPVRRLAGNLRTRVQAIAVGERAWGVQFHPEMDEAMVLATAEALGARPPLPPAAPSPDTRRLLRLFAERFGARPV